ncbi:MAG: RNA methyltransferase [Nitrospirota bacterium]|nr:RNA methyltransferase [Nitrospirota bacterium]
MRYTKITSATNQHIRDIIQIREKRAKFRHTAFLVEGPHLVEMALNAGVQIKEVFVTEAFMNTNEHQDMFRKITGTVFEVPEQILEKITDTETPQGIVAVAGYEPGTLDTLSLKATPLLVVLDAIQDPGNLGTIIRTADAAGADAIILLPGSCDAFMPKVIRATAGSIFNLPLIYAEPDTLVDWLSKKKIQLAVTAAAAGKTVFEAYLSDSIAIAFGNEAHGISDHLRKAADIFLNIPILGKAESLNVASSAAICLYEAVRQRKVQQ